MGHALGSSDIRGQHVGGSGEEAVFCPEVHILYILVPGNSVC